MTNTLNIGLNGLNLGPVALLNLADLPQVAQSPFHNSLQLHHQDAKLHLRHRASPQKLQRDQSFEVELGVVLAASAIVFASPLATVPKELTLLLLQKAVADQDEMAEPELVLIAPSRDGNSDLARPVDAVQQKLLLDAVQQQDIKVAAVTDDQVNIMDLVRAALLTGAYDEIDIPLNAEALLDIEFELPLELNFDADGLFYFRDVMNGEADFLFSHQSDFRAASVEISVTDGEFFLLEGDEQFLDVSDGVIEGGFSSATISLDGAERFFSRLVVQLDDKAEKADLGIEITVGSQVIVATNIAIHKTDIEDEPDQPIDDLSGLPEDEEIFELDANNHGVLPEEELTEDLFQLQPDVI